MRIIIDVERFHFDDFERDGQKHCYARIRGRTAAGEPVTALLWDADAVNINRALNNLTPDGLELADVSLAVQLDGGYKSRVRKGTGGRAFHERVFYVDESGFQILTGPAAELRRQRAQGATVFAAASALADGGDYAAAFAALAGFVRSFARLDEVSEAALQADAAVPDGGHGGEHPASGARDSAAAPPGSGPEAEILGDSAAPDSGAVEDTASGLPASDGAGSDPAKELAADNGGEAGPAPVSGRASGEECAADAGTAAVPAAVDVPVSDAAFDEAPAHESPEEAAAREFGVTPATPPSAAATAAPEHDPLDGPQAAAAPRHAAGPRAGLRGGFGAPRGLPPRGPAAVTPPAQPDVAAPPPADKAAPAPAQRVGGNSRPFAGAFGRR